MPIFLFNFIFRAFRHLFWNERYLLPLKRRKRLSYTAKIRELLLLKNKKRFRSQIDNGGAILIGGPARIGKSRAARFISEKNGFTVICLDDFKFIFRKVDADHVRDVKFAVLKVLLIFGDHLIIEGDELITDEADTLWQEYRKYHINEEFLKEVSNLPAADLYILGSSESENSRIADEIRNWSSNNPCWLSDVVPDENLDHIGLLLNEISSDLKKASERANFTYIETSDKQVSEVAGLILSKNAHS